MIDPHPSQLPAYIPQSLSTTHSQPGQTGAPLPKPTPGTSRTHEPFQVTGSASVDTPPGQAPQTFPGGTFATSRPLPGGQAPGTHTPRKKSGPQPRSTAERHAPQTGGAQALPTAAQEPPPISNLLSPANHIAALQRAYGSAGRTADELSDMETDDADDTGTTVETSETGESDDGASPGVTKKPRLDPPPLPQWMRNIQEAFPRDPGEPRRRYAERLGLMPPELLGRKEALPLAELALLAQTQPQALRSTALRLVPLPPRLQALCQEPNNQQLCDESKPAWALRLYEKYLTDPTPLTVREACQIARADYSTVCTHPRMQELHPRDEVVAWREKITRDPNESDSDYARRLVMLNKTQDLKLPNTTIAQMAHIRKVTVRHKPVPPAQPTQNLAHIKAQAEAAAKAYALRMKGLQPSFPEYIELLFKIDPALTLEDVSTLTARTRESVRECLAYQRGSLPHRLDQAIAALRRHDGEADEAYKRRLIFRLEKPKLKRPAQDMLSTLIDERLQRQKTVQAWAAESGVLLLHGPALVMTEPSQPVGPSQPSQPPRPSQIRGRAGAQPLAPDLPVKQEQDMDREVIELPRRHAFYNDRPILQDPENPDRSLLLEKEGPIDQIRVTSWSPDLNAMFATMPIKAAEKLKKDLKEQALDWLRTEGRHQERFDGLMYAMVPLDDEEGERGYAVFAKTDLPAGTMVGPYTGKLLETDAHEKNEQAQHGKVIQNYYFTTMSDSRVVSAFNTGNILSLINSPTFHQCNEETLKKSNIGSFRFGKNINFYVTLHEIKANDELLFDYGPTYRHIGPKPGDEAVTVKTEPMESMDPVEPMATASAQV